MSDEVEGNHEKITRLAGLTYRIQNHDAQQIEYQINSLWSTYYGLYSNYVEFCKAVEQYNETSEEMYHDFWQGGRNRLDIPRKYTPEEADNSPLKKHELFIYLRELVTKFNNYASAAYILQEEAQEFRKKWVSGEFEKQYYEMLHRTSLFEINNLIIDLRVYSTHIRSIPLAVNVNFKPEMKPGKEIGLTLSKGVIEENDDFNNHSEEYLKETELTGSNDDKIDIPLEVEKHYEAASTYYDWFIEAIYDSYKTEFEELEELKEKLAKQQGGDLSE